MYIKLLFLRLHICRSRLVGGSGGVMLEILFIKAALVTGCSPYVYQYPTMVITTSLCYRQPILYSS